MLGIEIDRRRIFGLDLLRALAILCVIHGHIFFLLNDTPLAFLMRWPMLHGVDMFFVLSGFLIGGAFLKHAESHQGTVGREKLGAFYARAALRILPCYYVILLLYYILVKQQIIAGSTETFSVWYFITFTQNLFTPFWDFFWESWTLSVEWWFYMIFPLLLLLSCRFVQPRKSVPCICLLFCIFSVIYRIIVSKYALDSFWWSAWIRKTVASRIDGIFIGVLAAWIHQYLPEKWNRHALICFVAGVLMMAFLCAVKSPVHTFYSRVVYSTLLPVSIALWLPLLCRMRSVKNAFGGIVSHLSVLSYSLFLTNLMVAQLIAAQYSDTFHRLGVWGYFLCWLLVLIAGYLLHVLVEKPFMKLRHKIPS